MIGSPRIQSEATRNEMGLLEVALMKRMLWIGVVMCAAQLLAQEAIPAGTVLPVTLSTSLHSRKLKAGQKVSARIMQDVPLAAGAKIRAGSKVMGHVIAMHPPTAAEGAKITLAFEALVTGKRQTRVVTNLRAVASMMAVHDAQLPETGPDRGTPENAWTTDQIGGEVVYRGGGPVARGLEVVGTPTYNGVLVRVATKPGSRCRGDVGGNDRPQALWVFSSDACGTYDLSNVTIAHAGRSDPAGKITLQAKHGDLNLEAGSGMLLRVDSTSQRF